MSEGAGAHGDAEEAVFSWLGAQLDSGARALRSAWEALVHERGLLPDLSHEERTREGDLVWQAWRDLLSRDRRHEALAQVCRVAERNMRLGRTIEETLGTFLAMRDAFRRHLFRASARSAWRLQLAVPLLFEERAQELMVCLAVACCDERERLVRRRMQVLVEAGMLLAADQSLDTVLQRVADLACGILGAESAALAVVGGEAGGGDAVRWVTAKREGGGEGAASVDGGAESFVRALPQRPVALTGATRDPRDAGLSVDGSTVLSFLAVPIRCHGHSFGNLYLAGKEDGLAFSEEDEALAAIFAAQAAAAIDNARRAEQAQLLADARRRERQQGELLQRVIAAQEEERKRVARELHDHTGQSLTSLLLGLRSVERAKSLQEARDRAADLRAHAERALDELHHLAFELRPSVLDDLGLVAALQRYAEEFARRTGVRLEVALDSFENRSLPPAVVPAGTGRQEMSAAEGVSVNVIYFRVLM
ncbi:MAG: GAF domain-containing protein [Armatimonadota bacterium]|nr:GAF domain-containing protein [Armatimonadota bacterium]